MEIEKFDIQIYIIYSQLYYIRIYFFVYSSYKIMSSEFRYIGIFNILKTFHDTELLYFLRSKKNLNKILIFVHKCNTQ